jgi:hypothetical protein
MREFCRLQSSTFLKFGVGLGVIAESQFCQMCSGHLPTRISSTDRKLRNTALLLTAPNKDFTGLPRQLKASTLNPLL